MNVNNIFDKSIHRFGIISGTFILLMMLAIPVLVSLVCGYFPNFISILPTIGLLGFTLLTAFFVEMVTYPSILGPGSLYMCYVTGNLINLKLPCAVASMEASNVKTGTAEGNAVAMVAVGVSSIVTMVIIFLGLIFMTPLEPIFQSASLKPVFDNVIPAMFGGLVGAKMLSDWKHCTIAIGICMIGTFIFKINQNYVMLICMVILLIISRISYNKAKQIEKAQ